MFCTTFQLAVQLRDGIFPGSGLSPGNRAVVAQANREVRSPDFFFRTAIFDDGRQPRHPWQCARPFRPRCNAGYRCGLLRWNDIKPLMAAQSRRPPCWRLISQYDRASRLEKLLFKTIALHPRKCSLPRKVAALQKLGPELEAIAEHREDEPLLKNFDFSGWAIRCFGG